MSAVLEEYRARLREALQVIGALKSKLDAESEPIAIIGLACRFPGGDDPEAFFRSLLERRDGMREIPDERWPADVLPGRPPEARWAALLEERKLTDFDAAFFGLSPREAAGLDPQQRLLLEIAWEAAEDAGLPIDALSGSRTGVFVGIVGADYQHRFLLRGPDGIDAWTATGNMASTAAGRVAFTMGLQGPCMSFDTACSSSLVAIVEACQSLRVGESDVAVAGGVNVVLSPLTMSMLVSLQALSPDGRCRTFDALANGYARGEGCGLIVLKRLSDALRDGDEVRAIIRGWAVNQDGRSTGLTTPNVLAQQALLRQAIARAGVTPDAVGYVETHGTGTALGDPIEVEALKAVYGRARGDGSSCVLGALKTNIGHLEGAAGVAGVIKGVLSLEHERIPPNIHFRRLNPRIDLEDTPFLIPQDVVPFPRGEKPRLSAVSAFGISGTNAHVILEEAPRKKAPEAALPSGPHLLPLSAKSVGALRALAGAHAERFSQAEGDGIADVAHTASLRRMHHDHRLAVVGGTREEMASALGAFARGEQPSGLVSGKVMQGRPKLAFVFSGQGSQWVGMGRQLLDQEEVFRAKLEACDALLRRHVSWSLLEELAQPEERSRLGQTEIVQPALFAIQVGIAELLGSWGIRPDAVIGHSVGEIAAAHVAGVISLEEAVRLVAHRGRIMQKATGRGKMVWVSLPHAEAEKEIQASSGAVSIGAINDTRSVVLSGETKALESIVAALTERGIAARWLRVDYAFHSAQMDDLSRELVGVLDKLAAVGGAIPVYSTVTGDVIAGESLDAAYWGRNMRETVLLERAVRASLRDGHRVLLEVGPHPVLLSNLEQCADEASMAVSALATLRRQADERKAMLEAIGGLYVQGSPVDWRTVSRGGKLVRLPSYPWQRKRHWVEAVWSGGNLAIAANAACVTPSSEMDGGPLVDRLRDLPLAERAARVSEVVTAVAARALGLAPSDLTAPDARFHDFGMDSIMATQIARDLGRALGVSIPSNAPLLHGSVAALAEAVLAKIGAPASTSASGAQRYEPLVAFRAEGSLAPFFLVHPLEGSPLVFQHLAKHLDPARPFYGIQARGLDTDDPPCESIDEMAELYVRAIRSVQPSGPYFLGGYSFGGIVAFEVARRLADAGEVVAKLVLVDAVAPTAFEEGGSSFVAGFARLNAIPLGDLDRPDVSLDEGAARLAAAMAERVGLDGRSPEGRRRVSLLQAHIRAMARYSIRKGAAPLFLLRANEPIDEASGAALSRLGESYGWSTWSEGGVTVLDVPGNHRDMMMTPHVEALGSTIGKILGSR